MKVELLTHTPEPEKIIAAAAKLCYSPTGIESIMENLTEENTEKFINHLMSLGHESPFEHVTFTFGIEGVSRSLLAQLTRHRIASYSVQSQRYVAKEDFSYIIPPEIEKIEKAKELFVKAMERDREDYRSLKEILLKEHTERLIKEGLDEKKARSKAEKIANEDARYVLSNACDTRIIMTMNVRSLYNFFSLRCCNRAQWEIREMALLMLKEVKKVSPLIFAKAGPSCISGACAEGAFTCGEAKKVREEYAKI